MIFTEDIINRCSSENERYFLWKIEKGWEKKNIPNSKEYIDRVNYEVDTISKMGFVDYMLIIADILDFANKNNLRRGAGRGSAAGSIVAYALDITRLDPIKYNLYFERFLNPERVSNPDVDIDLGTEKRHMALEHLIKMYGRDNVASISTFGKMWSRAIIRNVGKAIGMETGPGSDVDKIAKLFPSMERDFKEAVDSSEELKEYRNKYPRLFELSEKLSGKPKSVGIHAAGTVVTPMPVEEMFPMGRSAKGATSVTQWDMYDVEESGFVKLDLLGLNTLDVIGNTIDLIEQRYGKRIDIEAIDLSDRTTINLFRAGKTNGLFQLERKYVQSICKRMDINSFDDVCAINALIRPGTLHSGATELYIKRKTGEEEYICPHESVRECLKDTYGILLYQENIMRCVRDYAGFTMGASDNLRRIIGKKKVDKIEEVKKVFWEKARELGRPDDVTQFLWNQIDAAKNYSFNASHCYSYGKLTFQSGWLKCHYFLEFMTSLLNGEKNSNEPKLDSYLRECRLNGVQILPPNIMKKNALFQIEGKRSIRFGLSFIKGVTEKTVEGISKNIDKFNTFTDLLIADEGFFKKDVITNLIMVGAFDYIGGDRAANIEKFIFVKNLVTEMKDQMKRRERGVKVKKNYTRDFILNEEMNFTYSGEEMTIDKKISSEKELCDCYIINDPLAPFEEQIESEDYRDILDIQEGHFDKHSPVKFIAVVKSIRPYTITKGKSAGKDMCFVEVFDSLGEMDCVIFNNVYDDVKEDLAESAVYEFVGRYDGESMVVASVNPMIKVV